MSIFLIIIELIILFFLSRSLLRHLYILLFLTLRSRPGAITIITLILFPGTVVHELSHLFTAEILGVRTGKLELTPDSIRGDTFNTGSVMVAKSDPFRRYAIGLAPLATGIIILALLSYFSGLWLTPAIQNIQSGNYFNLEVLRLILNLYLQFAVANTMFSSEEDLKGFPAFAITIAIIIMAIYLVGLRIAVSGQILTFILNLTDRLSRNLGAVLLLNLTFWIIIKASVALILKILRLELK